MSWIIQVIVQLSVVFVPLGMLGNPYRRSAMPTLVGDAELARQALECELGPDERALWWGRATRGIVFHPSDAFAIPFCIVWTSLPALMQVAAIRSGNGGISVISLPFLLVGSYLLVGRFIVDACRRARTFYVLTDRRVVIAYQGRSRNVVAIDLAAAPAVTLTERTNGSGTLEFDEWLVSRDRHAQPGIGARLLELACQAREVFTMIRDVQRQLYARPRPRPRRKTQIPPPGGAAMNV